MLPSVLSGPRVCLLLSLTCTCGASSALKHVAKSPEQQMEQLEQISSRAEDAGAPSGSSPRSVALAWHKAPRVHDTGALYKAVSLKLPTPENMLTSVAKQAAVEEGALHRAAADELEHLRLEGAAACKPGSDCGRTATRAAAFMTLKTLPVDAYKIRNSIWATVRTGTGKCVSHVRVAARQTLAAATVAPTATYGHQHCLQRGAR